jgi:hypothetical protein
MMKKNYSHLLNPNHATLIFKCNYKTEYGQTLRIVGNIEELGSWEPSKSVIMTTDETKYPNMGIYSGNYWAYWNGDLL